MPYFQPLKMVAVAYLISTFFSIAGLSASISAYVKDICNMVLMPWMVWKVVNSREDFSFLIRGLCIAMAITCLYGFYEKIIQANPLVAYETTLVQDSSKVLDFRYDIDEYRGYRVQSVFEHPIGAGVNWAMFAVFSFFLATQYKQWRQYKFALVTVGSMCTLCVFFTSSRGPLLFFIIAALLFVNFRSKKFYKLLFITIIAVCCLSFFVNDSFFYNLLSIFDSSYQDKVGGSNADQRFGQLDAVLHLFWQSPIWGLGYKFFNVVQNADVRALLGMESIWFRVLTQFGLLGFLANIYLMYYSLIKIPRKFKRPPIFWISAAYWIVATMTSLPGYHSYLYYLIIFYFIKQNSFIQPERNDRSKHCNHLHE